MIVSDKIKKENIENPFTKAVADIERKILSLGCELHSDCADELIENGSRGSDLWGFNIYPDGHLDFVSLLNIKPAVGNRSMEIKDEEICRKIEEIVKKFL